MSRDEAIEWAKRCPAAANEVIEIRTVMEMADPSPDVCEASEGCEGLGSGRRA